MYGIREMPGAIFRQTIEVPLENEIPLDQVHNALDCLR